jgi:adenylosuccinate lyase
MISRYSRPELAALWDDNRRFELWLEIELAACEAMEATGTVPVGTATRVRAAAAGKLDAALILAIEATTRHDVIAFLTHVEELAGEPARWLHLGMTSSDVLDTALAIQTRTALDAIGKVVDGLLTALARRAREHATTPMIGRSHGIHAEPITAGLTFARWHAEVARAKARLARARDVIAVGKLAGAVGVYGNLDPAIEAAALGALGLVPETVATQIVARDRHAEVLCALALLGTAIEQIALGVRHWQRTEVGEAEEGFGQGQKGSSAMPHKKNPILSENLCGLARLLRSYAQAGLEDVALWHERDISHSSVERVAMPDATILADFMVVRATGLVDGLVVHPPRMRANLERTGGLYFSEAVLLALVKTGLPRQSAYKMVQRAALAAIGEAAEAGETGARAGRFRELLGTDPEIASRLTAAALDACFDLHHHLRHAPAILERALTPRFGSVDPTDRTREDGSPRGGDPVDNRRFAVTNASLDSALRAQLAQTLEATPFTRIAGRKLPRYIGKVRDCLIDRERGERIIIVTDRLSAFDAVVGTIPFKGQVLNQLAQFWFEHTKAIAPNHMLRVPDPNVMVARECTPLPVELVMRGYLTGVTSTSIWRAYEQGARMFCGHPLPDGMTKNQLLPRPILTPSTKAGKGDHDVSVSRDELLAMGKIEPAVFDRAAEIAAALFAEGQRHAANQGLILADTKYEMGLDRDGNIVVIDEIHTPDSSRYWYASDYAERVARGEEPRSLDKEYVRRWLANEAGWTGDGPPPTLPDDLRVEAARRYIASFELVTGTCFVPDPRPPLPRIAAALEAA